jgi:hypothetical protein
MLVMEYHRRFGASWPSMLPSHLKLDHSRGSVAGHERVYQTLYNKENAVEYEISGVDNTATIVMDDNFTLS